VSETEIVTRPFVHIFFMDGVGLSGGDPATNPFAAARLPRLDALLGAGWWTLGSGRRASGRASLAPTDATMGMDGRPQSATGQATILTGLNVPRMVGEHYGPKPNAAVAEVIRRGSLFDEVVKAGGRAALLTPYPKGYFEAIDSGKRLLSAVPLAATSAGLALMTVDDLRAGRAVSPDFTGQGWRDHLGYADVPLLTLEEAGRRIAGLAAGYTFSFFEHWPTDQTGHRGTMEEAVAHLEALDVVLGALVDAWDDTNGLLIVTSDHGNLEEKAHRQHTRNPVPTVLAGRGHAAYAERIATLVDIAGVVRDHLSLPTPPDRLQSGIKDQDYVD
jgi:hypothetical protein